MTRSPELRRCRFLVPAYGYYTATATVIVEESQTVIDRSEYVGLNERSDVEAEQVDG